MIIKFSTDLWLSNNKLNNILQLGFFLVLIFPYFWFVYIKKSSIKIISYFIYTIILLPFYLISSLAIIFTFNDVITNNGNGYIPLYQIDIENNEKLVIYKSPDSGALGGGEITPGIEKSIFPGIVSRKFSKNLSYHYGYPDSVGYVMYNDVKYMIPNSALNYNY